MLRRSVMRRDHEELVETVTAVAGALWRARLELALLALLASTYVGLRAVIGGTTAAIVVVAAVGCAVAVPVSRQRLLDALHAACVRRRLWHACRDADVPVPRARSVTRVLAGDQVEVRVPPGSSVAAIEERSEELAVCLRVRELRVVRDRGDASRGQVTLVRRDPLAELAGERWPEIDVEQWSLWDPIPIGFDEDGGTVLMSLPERNVLLGGEPGAGKSAALSVVIAVAALDPNARLWLLDGKLVELAAWAPCAQRVAGADVAEAIELLREVRAEMEARYRRLLRDGKRKVSRESGLELHLVAIDELAFYLSVEDRKQRGAFAELLRDLVARGRAAGVIVVAATQKPGSDVVPTALRDLFGFRLALRCNTPRSSDTILGQGWATLGYRASDIASADRGVGYLLAEGGVPVRLRTFFLADDDVSELAARATALRLQQGWSEAIAQERAAS
jgi:FtsK/SpoIIIE family